MSSFLVLSLITDSSGAQIGDTVKYLPFANCLQSPSLPTDKLFTGQRLDSTGLYFYNARYYDPTIGRFISPDTVIPNPANPQCFNRYSYCLNNPLKYIDPSGHDSGMDPYMLLLEWGRSQTDETSGSQSQPTNAGIYSTSGTPVPGYTPPPPEYVVEVAGILTGTSSGAVKNHYSDSISYKVVEEGFLLPCGIIVTDHVLTALGKRGWTLSDIYDAYANPLYTSPAENLSNDNPATAYYRSFTSGDYVVIDDVTMKTVQIGQAGDPYWIPNPAISKPIPSLRNPVWGTGYDLPHGYYGPDLKGNWPW